MISVSVLPQNRDPVGRLQEDDDGDLFAVIDLDGEYGHGTLNLGGLNRTQQQAYLVHLSHTAIRLARELKRREPVKSTQR
jgi:hypothetical protein